ncbi:hypothetical protein ACO0RG_000885 [Hanseniaspora osmophila]
MSRFAKYTHLELIQLAQKTIIPPLSSRYHKGQVGGRVCVVGGSFKFCGAPFFAANATMLYGSDLTYLVCSDKDHDLSSILKIYSPNLMVNPVLSEPHLKCESFLHNVHSVVIGPGLGRREDEVMQETNDVKFDNVIKILQYCVENKIFVVIDADGLYLLSNDNKYKSKMSDLLKNHGKYIALTPNVIELKRLQKEYPDLYTRFPGLIILEKGKNDKIISTNQSNDSTNEENPQILENTVESHCLKRCGGQGDTLTGCLATQLGWCNILLRDDENSSKNDDGDDNNNNNNKEKHVIWPDRKRLENIAEYKVLSAYVVSTVVKLASSKAFAEKFRSMQTTDLNNKVGEAFYEIFGDTVEKE